MTYNVLSGTLSLYTTTTFILLCAEQQALNIRLHRCVCCVRNLAIHDRYAPTIFLSVFTCLLN